MRLLLPSLLMTRWEGDGHQLKTGVTLVHMRSVPHATWEWVRETVRRTPNATAISAQVYNRWLQHHEEPTIPQQGPAQPISSLAGSQSQVIPEDIEVEDVHPDQVDVEEMQGEQELQGHPPFDFPEEAWAREKPDIPSHAPSTAQDVSAIAGVDLLKLFFADIKLVTRVPRQFQEQWVKANSVVYTWVLQSEAGSQERDNALFWELLLHRLLLRADPRSRGKRRASKDTMASRFKAFNDGDYQSLVQRLVRVVNAAKNPFRVPLPMTEDDTLKAVNKLLTAGRYSKAFRLMDSKGQGNMNDPGVVAQLDRKHGHRVHILSGRLSQGLPDRVGLDGKLFHKVYRSLKPRAGTGPSGYRNEYLTALTCSFTCPIAKVAVDRHREAVDLYVNADLPAWYYWVATSCAMVALIKSKAKVPGGTPDVRPIGMGECRRRAWTSVLMKQNAKCYKKTFWSIQVAVGVSAGVPKLVFAVREHMMAHPNHVLLKLDFTNAFNTVWRAAILRACYENPEWRHLYRFYWATLSPMAVIVGITKLSEEGVQQGDAGASAGFCKPVQPHAKWAHEELQKHDGFAVFDMDDGYMVGPIDQLMRVVAEFQQRLIQHVGAVLNFSKRQLWCVREHRQHVASFISTIDGNEFELAYDRLQSGHRAFGVMVSGVPFGDNAFVQHRMKRKVGTIVSQIKKTTKRLQSVSCQNLFALLVQCLNCKLQFWLQCMPGRQIKEHLRVFDRAMVDAVRVATGMKLPRDH